MIINILGNPPKKEEIEKYKNYLKSKKYMVEYISEFSIINLFLLLSFLVFVQKIILIYFSVSPVILFFVSLIICYFYFSYYFKQRIGYNTKLYNLKKLNFIDEKDSLRLLDYKKHTEIKNYTDTVIEECQRPIMNCEFYAIKKFISKIKKTKI